MEKNVIVTIVVVTIFVALFMNAQLPTNSNQNLAEGIFPENDLAFLKWANMVSESMRSHILDITNATKEENYDDLEKYGKSLQADTALYLNQSSQHNVSPTIDHILSDLRKSLENYAAVGKYVEMSAKNRDNESLYTAVDYAKNAEYYMRNASVGVQNHAYK